ncbi:MAG: DNA-directed RNA polymerase subunit omega [Puniceicoccales bacterium]|jgi:DNA-directed RNA polymerase subunit omega|nr:DNA-directed RNA polymerase subunit omega [Puniceicoccales bacterium]
MRDDYLKQALQVVQNPNILINLVSLRVRQLRKKNDSVVESLEHLELEDVALREIIEGKLTYMMPEEKSEEDDFDEMIFSLSSE